MSRFVYGSLLAPEVLDALLGRVPDRTPATLPGFVRRRIKDAVFPAIYPAEDPSNASVSGEVLTGMSRRELAVLDWFEDEAYVLTRVDVTFDEELSQRQCLFDVPPPAELHAAMATVREDSLTHT